MGNFVFSQQQYRDPTGSSSRLKKAGNGRQKTGIFGSRRAGSLHRKKTTKPTLPANVIEQKKVQMILFGCGEAGKTTIMRQMRLAKGQHLNEKTKYGGNILVNLVEGAGMTIRAGKELFKLPFKDKNAETIEAEYVRTLDPSFKPKFYTLNRKVAIAIKEISATEDFKYVLKHRSEYQIHDGWFFFLEQLNNGYPEWGGPGWTPSNPDLLHSRIRTVGKVVLDFEYDEMKLQLVDVGGQRVERRKFFRMFRDVDCILFVASLSEYNQKLFENRHVNRLTETMTLWEKTVNHTNFESSWFLILLNKVDLLIEKFKEEGVPIEPEFKCKPPPLPADDDNKCTLVREWYEELFLSKVHSENKRKEVRVYFTNAMDRSNIKVVIEYCSSILKHNFAASNVM